MTTPPEEPNNRPNTPEPPEPPQPPQPYAQQPYPTNQQPYPTNQQPYPTNQQPYPTNQQPYPAYQPSASPSSGLYVAAAVINWVVLGLTVFATLGFGIIAAAWMVPMTILTHKGAKDGYKHTGLAVCTLLFCGLISGILMLVDEGNRRPKPVA